jgi:hypothetical protein
MTEAAVPGNLDHGGITLYVLIIITFRDVALYTGHCVHLLPITNYFDQKEFFYVKSLIGCLHKKTRPDWFIPALIH